MYETLIIWTLFALCVILLIFIVYTVQLKKKPLVVVFDPDTCQVYNLGRFKRWRDEICMEVDDGYKTFWWLEADQGTVLPAKGIKEHLIIPDLDGEVFVIPATVFGDGWNEEAQQKWLSEAFPKSTYRSPPAVMKVPDDCMLVTLHPVTRTLGHDINALFFRDPRLIKNL